MSIVLVGPPGAGKSTVGARLAPALGRDFVDADGVCGPLYAEVGWSAERLVELAARVGYERAHREWEPALAHAVERLVGLHPTAVIALGAGHTHPTRAGLFERVRRALGPAERVVLLRPAADAPASVRILRARCVESKGRDWIRDDVDWLERWCTDGRDERLATQTVFTTDEPVARTVERLRRDLPARAADLDG